MILISLEALELLQHFRFLNEVITQQSHRTTLPHGLSPTKNTMSDDLSTEGVVSHDGTLSHSPSGQMLSPHHQ